MRAVLFDGPKSVRVEDLATPRPGPSEVLVKVEACGICGTDGHIYLGEYALANYPVVAGHEMAGTIAALGPGVAGWREGDRVTLDPNIFCGECYYCRSNRANHCENIQVIGVNRQGGFAEYVVVPTKNIFALPDSLSFEEGALIEPVSCVAYALSRIQMKPASSVLVFGAGPMGQLIHQAVRRSGASSLVIVDLDPKRLALAQKLGAEQAILAGPDQDEALRKLQPRGFDVVIDVTGVPKVVEGLFNYAKPTAKILFFGVCPADAKVSISPYDIFQNDYEIYGSFALRYTFHEAIELMLSGSVQTAPLVSHRMALSELSSAFTGNGFPAGDADGLRLKVLAKPGLG